MKINPPTIVSLSDILPAEPTLLMGAGPVPIPKEVSIASGIVISHLGDTMREVITRVQNISQYVFQTTSSKIIGISGPSSAAMEMATSSLVWPGRKVLVLNMGMFSGRFAEMARGLGAQVTELKPHGLFCFKAIDVEEELKKNSYDVITLVQGETSCGIKNIELPEIIKAAKKYNVRTIVDSVCTLSTMPMLMDEWGIDIALTGGQKGLSVIPGISLIAFSEECFEFIEKRETLMPHWCLDPRRAIKFWGKGEYHYTAPVSAILALYEGLRIICEETLEKRFERHLNSSQHLQKALNLLGFELYAPIECRLNSVLSIKNINQVNTKELIKSMIKNDHVEIAGAFGLDIIRIGQMGEQCRLQNIKRVIQALANNYSKFGVTLDIEAANKYLSSLDKEK